MLDQVAWSELPPFDGDELHATHEGYIDFGPYRFKCYVLSNGQRVLDEGDVTRFFSGEAI